jgi:FkbM family methyltransferase
MVVPFWTDSFRRLARGTLPGAAYHLFAHWYGEHVSARVIGSEEYRRLKRVEAAGPGGEPEEFRVPGLAAPVYVRPGTTDAAVFQDNLLRRIYGCHKPAVPVHTILDAGANAGYASVFFLNRFLNATVIAVEPDAANFAITQRNLAPYGARARCLRMAIWPTASRLRVEACAQADSVTVRPAGAAEACDCEGIDPLSLLRDAGWERISIFKCDIEGGEEKLVGENPDAWIERTDSILMEIHSPRAQRSVYSAMARHPFAAARYRELHVFIRRPSATGEAHVLSTRG